MLESPIMATQYAPTHDESFVANEINETVRPYQTNVS